MGAVPFQEAKWPRSGNRVMSPTFHQQPGATGVQPQDARSAVRLEFRIAASQNVNEKWDLDNLIKPTLDAMEGIFGLRPWKGHPQSADDRVDRLEVVKHLPREGESIGATIDVWVITPDSQQGGTRLPGPGRSWTCCDAGDGHPMRA
jgi:hypothetical protein